MPSTRTSSRFTNDQVQSLTQALSSRVAGEVRTDDMSRALYATDASMYQMRPLGVLIPQHVGDVQSAVEVAADLNMPVLPRGGGSSLAGQGVNEALVVDFTRHMDAVERIDPDAQTATVQPGVTLDQLNRAAAEYGLMVGPDPASSSRATIGGMLANNSTGTHSIRYGNFIHHVEQVRALLSDGSLATFGPTDHDAWQRGMRASGREGEIYRGLQALLADGGAETIRTETPSHWRRNNGYRLEALLEDPPNLARLLCGSEGTLAIATEITCRLVEKPVRTGLGIAHFETRDDALRAVTTVLDTDPTAVELFDGVAIERTRQTPGYAERLTFIDGTPGGILITEYYGDTEAELEAQIDVLEDRLSASERGTGVVRVTEPDAVDNVWSIRKEGLGLIMGVKGEYKPWAFIEDASVPVENLADYIEELSQFIDDTDTKAAYYAHASAGTLHVRPFVNTKDRAEVEKMRDIAQASLDLVLKYGGVVSSEHGDGMVRGWANPAILGEDLYALCRETKEIFDPDRLLNPGKIVDAPEMTDNLRLGPDYDTRPFPAELDWSAEGGFAEAVEKCNGNGACRKLHSGTMCPSFMATRDEEDSTRGRANALRMALSGGLSEEDMTGERMHEVMDLCVQCKACKTECPSNVDMAKMKTEWLNHYWTKNRMPLRSWLFAHQPRLVRWVSGTPWAGVANWMGQQSFVRRLGEALVGVDAERELPPFARETFYQWFERHAGGGAGPEPETPKPVVLFADTFNAFHTPAPLQAAVEVLRATGHRVHVPETKPCCGRTLLSKGRISEAQERALRTVEALHPYAERGIPIVGLEPSCILTLRDEFLDLLPGDPRAQVVAEVTRTFDEYLAHQVGESEIRSQVRPPAGTEVLLHGHCHQKALTGTDATEDALGAAGFDVHAVDAGCCGMAGAFGYEQEHVDVSTDMAELRLAPAVRSVSENTAIAATGFSCRSQIKDVTGRTARHPAELIAECLQRATPSPAA